ncbi:polyprenol monophosphomannose synthase [Candidatus Omnitrophota bacterium]
MSTVVIIPTYNERNNIENLIKQILKLYSDINILVVDSCSPDGTGRVVEGIGQEFTNVHIINQQKKLGLALAFQEGFRWALEKNFDYIVQMDGDFSHNPKDISDLVKAAEKQGLCIGSRYIPRGQIVDWVARRKILSYIGNIYVRFLLGLPVKDCTSGFRCFRKDVLAAIDLDAIKSTGYLFQIEIVNYCIRAGVDIIEVPIVFTQRKKGYSKLGVREVAEAIVGVFKLMFCPRRAIRTKS